MVCFSHPVYSLFFIHDMHLHQLTGILITRVEKKDLRVQVILRIQTSDLSCPLRQLKDRNYSTLFAMYSYLVA